MEGQEVRAAQAQTESREAMVGLVAMEVTVLLPGLADSVALRKVAAFI